MINTNYQLRARAVPEKLSNISLNDSTVKRCIDYYISSDITMHEMLVLLVEHLAREKNVYLKQALGVVAIQKPQLVIGAFKAGEAAYVDTEGDLRAAIDAACTVAYADGRKDEAEAVQDEPHRSFFNEIVEGKPYEISNDIGALRREVVSLRALLNYEYKKQPTRKEAVQVEPDVDISTGWANDCVKLQAEINRLTDEIANMSAEKGIHEQAIDLRNAEINRLLAVRAVQVGPRGQHPAASKLLYRSLKQLDRWSMKYGQWQPEWLPPAGDIELAEDIEEYLARRVSTARDVQPEKDGAPGNGTVPAAGNLLIAIEEALASLDCGMVEGAKGTLCEALEKACIS